MSVTVRTTEAVIASHVRGCVVILKQPRFEWGERRGWWNLFSLNGSTPLAQADTAEELEAWAKENGARVVEVFS